MKMPTPSEKSSNQRDPRLLDLNQVTPEDWARVRAEKEAEEREQGRKVNPRGVPVIHRPIDFGDL